MAKILINDGIHPTGKALLEHAGHEVDSNKIEQDDLINKLQDYAGICVRSATKVRKDLIDACPDLKFVGRGGVGLDNIDVEHAKDKGVAVLNTPAASSRSVAELVFGHLLSCARFVYQSNREMPVSGNEYFKALKKSYAGGVELEGKTIGIIGMGRIGQEAAKIAFGMGMNVIGVDPYQTEVSVNLTVGGQTVNCQVALKSKEEMLKEADFITLHVPYQGEPVLGATEFEMMKTGVIIANASRGGTIDEAELMKALDAGKVARAGLDVFENEPTPSKDILSHKKISLTPHIGASTFEAQEKIGIELAEKIIEVLK